ncbi:MAG: Trp family transcriptional regulator [Candidatus Levybacteria bacterium]|nr:Trp family transcriptional regulator [Candidatus Levybacteria bacterium]
MTQVSKYPIHKDVEKRMFEIFKSTISRLKNNEDIEDFLEDFLSPVEKIMLSKRLAIAVLLAKGHNYPAIAEILRVTPSTIASVSLRLKYSGKGYKKVVERILAMENQDNFWQKVEDVLTKIPKSKGSNWVYQKQEHEKQKRVKRKAF